jgi:hypothetical protein
MIFRLQLILEHFQLKAAVVKTVTESITCIKILETRRMVSSGMLRRVALVRTDVSEELRAYFIRVTRIGELATTLAVTSNRRTLRRIRHSS